MAKWEYGLLFDSAKAFLQWLKDVKVTVKITATHMHHTWRPNHASFKGNNYRSMQDGMKNHHVNTNKWPDIAQHITIFPDGKVMTGRDINLMPISATGYNGTTAAHPFMFEMIGDFNKGNDKLEGKQLESAIDICRHFGNVVFHRECLINGKPPKTCPGTGIDKTWFMNLVKEDAKVEELKKQVEKLSKNVGELTALIPAPKWFVDEFGSSDLDGLINDPRFTSEGWRTLAVALRAMFYYKRP